MALSIASMGSSIGELQRDYLHKLVVLQMPSGYKGSVVAKEAIDCYLTKGVFPNRKTAEIAIKWGGETAYFSGVDESPKTGDLVFRADESMNIKDFWEGLKDLTGDVAAHAAVPKSSQTLMLAVYLVSVNKDTITDARRLTNVIVYSVEDINPDKEGSGIQTFKVHISWDHSETLPRGGSLGAPNSAAKEEDTVAGKSSGDGEGGGGIEGEGGGAEGTNKDG
jgi:hypothetical protein